MKATEWRWYHHLFLVPEADMPRGLWAPLRLIYQIARAVGMALFLLIVGSYLCFLLYLLLSWLHTIPLEANMLTLVIGAAMVAGMAKLFRVGR